MEKEILDQLEHFKIVKVPRYLTDKIQSCALNHLNLKDMGQLRDRMEGQLYYDKLKDDILAEYAFEKLCSKTTFDWDKRMNKRYKRKSYIIQDLKIQLITFNPLKMPKISLEHTNLCILVWVLENSKVYLSDLATKELFYKYGVNIRNNIYELKKFDKLIPFSSKKELELQISKMASNIGYVANSGLSIEK